MKIKTLLLTSILASLAHLPVANAQVLFDFNTTSQLADNFNKGTTAGSGSGSLTNVASGGLSDSGSLAIPTGVGNDSFLYATKGSFSATTASFDLSIYFKAQAATISGGALSLSMGLVDDSTPTTTSGTSAVGIPDAATSNSLVLSLRNAGNGTASGLSYNLTAYNNAVQLTPAASSSVTLTDGNWYQLRASYTYTGSNNYSLIGQIYASDNAGVLGSALIGSNNSWTATNAGLADGITYSMIGSQNGNRRGLGQLDNFSTVPEPSTMILVGMALSGALFLRRRNKRV